MCDGSLQAMKAYHSVRFLSHSHPPHQPRARHQRVAGSGWLCYHHFAHLPSTATCTITTSTSPPRLSTMDQKEPASDTSTFQDLQHTHRFVIPGLSQESYTVLAAASSVRIYHAQSRSHEWRYSRLKGTLIFGKDNDQQTRSDSQATSVDVGKYWFRVFDATSRILKPIWVFKLPALGFVYELDRPFFHAFQGMVSIVSRIYPIFSFLDIIRRAAGSASCLKTTTKLGRFSRTFSAKLLLVCFLCTFPSLTSDNLSPYGKLFHFNSTWDTKDSQLELHATGKGTSQ